MNNSQIVCVYMHCLFEYVQKSYEVAFLVMRKLGLEKANALSKITVLMRMNASMPELLYSVPTINTAS